MGYHPQVALWTQMGVDPFISWKMKSSFVSDTGTSFLSATVWINYMQEVQSLVWWKKSDV